VREEVREEGGPPRRVLGLHHTRTVKMPEDVLAVRITPDGRLLALALLDSTVQVGIL
jgi:U3 small nucleolar RNA-associated protein 12